MYGIIKRPLITEKSAELAEGARTYVFEVDRRANKTEIRKAVEKGFDVKVKSVRTVVTRGRWLKKYAKFGPPKYSKKAIVRLMPGEAIAIFEGA